RRSALYHHWPREAGAAGCRTPVRRRCAHRRKKASKRRLGAHARPDIQPGAGLTRSSPERLTTWSSLPPKSDRNLTTVLPASFNLIPGGRGNMSESDMTHLIVVAF